MRAFRPSVAAGIVTGLPPRSSFRSPPTDHRMEMKAAAPNTAETRPRPRSTSGSVAQRVSSAMRYSGLAGSVRETLSS